MNYALGIFSFVLAAIAVAFFVKVGKAFKENEYSRGEDKRRQDEEKKRFEAAQKQADRELRHETRLQAISDARDNPDRYEQLLNSWPDDPSDPTASSASNGSGGGTRRDMH